MNKNVLVFHLLILYIILYYIKKYILIVQNALQTFFYLII